MIGILLSQRKVSWKPQSFILEMNLRRKTTSKLSTKKHKSPVYSILLKPAVKLNMSKMRIKIVTCCHFPRIGNIYILFIVVGGLWRPDEYDQGLVKGAILCFRNPYFYFWHGESTSTASKLTSPASQKSKDLKKVSLLLQDLASASKMSWKRFNL